LYATNETQIENTTNLTIEQVTTETSNYTINNSNNSAGPSAAGDLSSRQTEINNSNNSAGPSAAGDLSSTDIRGMWLRADHVVKLNVTNLRNANITDIFVNTPHTTPSRGILNYREVLDSIITKLNNTGIRIHAWIVCFKVGGEWFDPQGRYSYQVQVPYTEVVRVHYRVRVRTRHRVRFFSRGRWRTRWVTRWTTRIRTRTIHRQRHRQETRFGNRTRTLLNSISNLTMDFSGRIHGIHLDYARYRGVGDGTAYRHNNGTEVITAFVRDVSNRVRDINNSIKLSAALMPEPIEYTIRYYGEDAAALSQHLDFMVPMVYRGNFKQGREWITNTTRYFIRHSRGKPVVAGILTYVSDRNLTALPADELKADIAAARNGGSSGFVLFRYCPMFRLINSTFFECSGNPSNPSNPSNVTVNPTPPEIQVPSGLQRYLQETRNSQVNNPAIRSLAASITSGATSTYNKATRLFNWVMDNIRYSFYRNTRKGAVGTLNSRSGNCVDQSHLLIALSRAAGIPARYMHGRCTFIPSGNVFGHVWPQMWVNGRWHNADTTSSRNRFGVINNWNTRTVVMRGTHVSLPF